MVWQHSYHADNVELGGVCSEPKDTFGKPFSGGFGCARTFYDSVANVYGRFPGSAPVFVESISNRESMREWTPMNSRGTVDHFCEWSQNLRRLSWRRSERTGNL